MSWPIRMRLPDQDTEISPLRRMGPLKDDHPIFKAGVNAVYGVCLACRKRIVIGDFITLVPLGPGDDPESRAQARAGRFFVGESIPVHWGCATGGDV